jgi:membrane protease YdiL (CAAX protease family)
LKAAARLLAYFAATVLFAALGAPFLYWAAQGLASRGIFPFLAAFDFETFFHRALLIGALLFIWPLLRSLRIRNACDLELAANKHPLRDVGVGFGFASVPLFLFGALLIFLGVYSLRTSIPLGPLVVRTLSVIVVPFIEEPVFRGLILGVFLRGTSKSLAVLFTSALFSILHFLKAPEHTSTVVTWTSGFLTSANAFNQFANPLVVLAGFTTLFLLGWILADARIRTRSLWLPIGLHAGWIFANAVFNRVARREMDLLPLLGKNLLIGIAPLCVALLTWVIIRVWLKHVESNP